MSRIQRTYLTWPHIPSILLGHDGMSCPRRTEASTHITLQLINNNIHHRHHHISFIESGHLLTRSSITYPEVSSNVIISVIIKIIIYILILLLLLIFIDIALLTVNGGETVYSKLNGKFPHHSDTLSHIPAKCNAVGTDVAADVICQI